MKKLLIVILVVVLCFGAFAFFGGNKDIKIEKANFDSVALVDDFELTVDGDIVTANQLNGDEDQFEEFLTTDMTNYGDTTLCDVALVAKEGQTMLVVSYSIKNTSQSEESFNEKVVLNYNDGYEYESTKKYYTFGGTDDWHEYTSLELNPLTTIMCKAYFTVPNEVAENTQAPLKLIISNQEYTIR